MVHKKSFDESGVSQLSDEERAKLDEDISEIARGDDPVGALSTVIAPEIFVHEDINRAIFLQLVGGARACSPMGCGSGGTSTSA